MNFAGVQLVALASHTIAMELADLSAWPEMLGLGSGSHLTAIALAAASSLARTLELYICSRMLAAAVTFATVFLFTSLPRNIYRRRESKIYAVNTVCLK